MRGLPGPAPPLQFPRPLAKEGPSALIHMSKARSPSSPAASVQCACLTSCSWASCWTRGNCATTNLHRHQESVLTGLAAPDRGAGQEGSRAASSTHLHLEGRHRAGTLRKSAETEGQGACHQAERTKSKLCGCRKDVHIPSRQPECERQAPLDLATAPQPHLGKIECSQTMQCILLVLIKDGSLHAALPGRSSASSGSELL